MRNDAHPKDLLCLASFTYRQGNRQERKKKIYIERCVFIHRPNFF